MDGAVLPWMLVMVLCLIGLPLSCLSGWWLRGWTRGFERQATPTAVYRADGAEWRTDQGQRALETDMAEGDPWDMRRLWDAVGRRPRPVGRFWPRLRGRSARV